MLGEISFAGKIGYNIKFDDVKQRLLDDLHDHFGFRVIQKHHERYHDGIINKLTSNPHMVCLRSNGNPYLLYLTKINFVQQCVFVDKKIQQGYFYPRMIMSRFRFDDRLFDNGGTLLDGEMIRTSEGKWLFVLGDMIAHQGTHLSNTNLVKRINMLYNMMRNQFTAEECDICAFQVKKYVTYSEISSLVTEFMPQLPYTSRGLYFKPLFLKFKDILYNFDDSLIVKVMRKKYKNVSNFLLEEDKACLGHDDPNPNPNPNPQLQPQPKPPSATTAKATTSINPKQTIPVNSTTILKTFLVKKTNLPDVYEMVATQSTNMVEIACIPTLATSKFMRSLFESKNVTDKLELRCVYSERFGKFIPVALHEPTSAPR
jgi:hypothetical protein